MIEHVLVWNGRTADPAPSERGALGGAGEVVTAGADVRNARARAAKARADGPASEKRYEPPTRPAADAARESKRVGLGV